MYSDKICVRNIYVTNATQFLGQVGKDEGRIVPLLN
jgi:hypothetical protein